VPKFEVAAQGRGPETYHFMEHVHRLGAEFALVERTGLPTWLDTCSFVFRVDGSLGSFGGTGVDRVRVMKKGRYVQVDVCIPVEVWYKRPCAFVAARIAEFIRDGMEKLIAGIKRHDRDFDEACFCVAITHVLDRFVQSRQSLDQFPCGEEPV
jgi:hypothetical protein